MEPEQQRLSAPKDLAPVYPPRTPRSKMNKPRAAEMEETLNVTQALADKIESVCVVQQDNFMKLKARAMKQREITERTKALETENEILKTSRNDVKAKLEKAKESLEEIDELRGEFAWTKAALESANASQEEYRRGYKSMRAALKKTTEEFDKYRDDITTFRAEKKKVELMKERYKVIFARTKANTEKVVSRMSREEDLRLQGYFIQMWLQGAAESKKEGKSEQSAFAAEVDRKNAQAEFERNMLAKKEVAKRTLARMDANKTTGLLGMVFSSWDTCIREDKIAREAEKVRQEVEARLKGMEARKKEGAKAVLDRMSNNSDTGLKGWCFNGWKVSWEESVAAKELEKRTRAADEQAAARMGAKKEEAKKMLAKMHASSDGALATMVFSQWGTWALTERKERKLAEAAEEKFLELQKKKKGEAASVVTRMNLRKGKDLMQKIFTGWVSSISQYHLIREIEENAQVRFDAIQKEIDQLREQLEDKNDDLEDVQEELAESQKRHVLLKEKIEHMNETHNGLLQGFDDLVLQSDL